MYSPASNGSLICPKAGLAGYLANANAVSSDGAIPVISVQDGADQLLNDVNNLINKLGTIQSEKVFTV